jgi:hypothetical protein
MSETPAFSHLTDQFTALHEGPGGAVAAGHLDLGPDLWLSADPAGQAVMAHEPCEPGVRLSLTAGDSGGWACLGLRIAPGILAQARYLGLLTAGESESLISFTPTLRYFLRGGGLRDVATQAPVILARGVREHLAYIPVDRELLDGASGCELNLFFHTDAFVAEFSKIEPLLIL